MIGRCSQRAKFTARSLRSAAFAAVALSCSHRAPAPPSALLPPPAPAAAPSIEGEWVFEVAAGSGAKELSIIASFPQGSEVELGVDDGAEPFVRDVALIDGNRQEPVAPSDQAWTVPTCRAKGCRLHYRFLLSDASTAIGDPDVALAHDEVFVAPPSTWLLRPLM